MNQANRSISSISRRRFLKMSAGAAGLLALAACVPAAPQPAAPAEEAAKPEAAAEAIRLRLMTWSGGEELELHKKAFKAFTDANAGIEVEVTAVPFGEYYTKLQTEAAGGSAADLINIGEAYTARWAASKVVINMNPYIEADPEFHVEDFFPNVLENFKWEGGVYVLPKDYVTWALFYNKALFDEAGIPYPDDTWTWNPTDGGQYTEIATKLTKQEGGRTVQYGTMASTGWGYYFPRIWDNGGRYLNDDRTQCLLAEPEAVAAVQWIADLVNKYGVAPTAETEQGGFTFASGKIAMMPQGSYMVPGLLNAQFDWAVAPHPQGPQGRHSIMYSSGYGISSQSKYADAAWKLAVFMTREGSEILAVTGFSVPSRQSVAKKPGLYLNEQTIPHNVQVFLDASAYMGLHEITPTWTQEEQIISAELTLVMAGEKTAQEALTAVVPKITELLAG